MRRATFLLSARADLVSIFDYLAEASGSIAVAETFVGKLRNRCHTLAGYKTIVGRARPELGPKIRSVPFGNYVIVLRYQGGKFEVVNIVEGHRDIDAHIGEDHS